MPIASPPVAEITLLRGGEVLARVVLEPGEYVFGQAESCEFSLNLPGIVPRHARLRVSATKYRWDDLESGATTKRSLTRGAEATTPFHEMQLGPLLVKIRSLSEPPRAAELATRKRGASQSRAARRLSSS